MTLEKELLDPMKAVLKLVNRIRLTEDEAGIVTLWKSKDHGNQKLLRRLKLRVPEYTALTLDEYGSFVIKQIDGTTTVEAIGIT